MKKIIVVIILSLILAGGMLLYVYFDSHRPHHFEVDFLNIGQGDSALIKFENGQKMLVDCGPNKIVLSALGRHLPFYNRTIDYVVATHPDLDHYGGCVDVLQRYNVKNIIVNGHEKKYDPYWQEWNKMMHEEAGAKIITMASPTTWTIASDTLQFISPDPALHLDVAAADSNNYSIVFKLTHGNERFLFTGDMEVPLEDVLMEKYCGTTTPDLSLTLPPSSEDLRPAVGRGANVTPPPQGRGQGEDSQMGARERVGTCPALHADTLKVGHHGSDSGSSEEFLSIVRAKTAIVSVGKNKYGHPSHRVFKRLERTGADILRTDQIGDIVVQ